MVNKADIISAAFVQLRNQLRRSRQVSMVTIFSNTPHCQDGKMKRLSNLLYLGPPTAKQ